MASLFHPVGVQAQGIPLNADGTVPKAPFQQLQNQIDNIEVTPGSQGPQGPAGPAGADGTGCTISGSIVTCGTDVSDVQGPQGSSASPEVPEALSIAEVLALLGLSMKNYLLNADFDIWQERTHFTITTGVGGVNTDLWRHDRGTGAILVISRQAFAMGQTDVPDNPTYYMRVNRIVAGIAASAIGQRIEDVRTLAGKNATWTFWARSAAGTFTLKAQSTQIFGTAGSSDVITAQQDINLTTTWQKFTVTLAIGSLSGKTVTSDSAVAFQLKWFETEGPTNSFDIAHTQVVAGDVGQTVFEHKTFAESLLEAQRYRFKSFPYATAPAQAAGGEGAIGRYVSVGGELDQGMRFSFPVPMYSTGGIGFFNPGDTNALWYNVTGTANSGAASVMDEDAHGFTIKHTQVSGDNAGDYCLIHFYKNLSIGP